MGLNVKDMGLVGRMGEKINSVHVEKHAFRQNINFFRILYSNMAENRSGPVNLVMKKFIRSGSSRLVPQTGRKKMSTIVAITDEELRNIRRSARVEGLIRREH